MPFRVGSELTAGDSSGTTLVFTPPTAWATGDVIPLELYVESLTLTPSFDKGTWTKITAASGKNSNASSAFETHVYRCVWDDAITGDITISWGGANVWRTVTAIAESGRHTASPEDATATYNENETDATAVTALAVTTANANADIVAFGANRGGPTWAWTGVTERTEFGGVSIADAVQASAGSSGNKTATLSVAFAWSAGLIALREAPAGGAGPVARRQHIDQAVNRSHTY